MKYYHVWDYSGVYLTDTEAVDEDHALHTARTKFNIIAPMVQEIKQFMQSHNVLDKPDDHQQILNNQYLRYADIKDSESRTWRDRKY